jgi:hypothetical protein
VYTSMSAAARAETPADREARLQREREASERLRAKFGDAGLKGQSVSNGMGYMPPSQQSSE